MSRICDHFSKHPLQTAGVTISVSISFGIAAADKVGASSPKSLLKEADEALYKVKKSHKAKPLQPAATPGDPKVATLPRDQEGGSKK